MHTSQLVPVTFIVSTLQKPQQMTAGYLLHSGQDWQCFLSQQTHFSGSWRRPQPYSGPHQRFRASKRICTPQAIATVEEAAKHQVAASYTY